MRDLLRTIEQTEAVAAAWRALVRKARAAWLALRRGPREKSGE